MGLIGIIVNPFSGKDVRRIVSSATVVSNIDKMNIIERIMFAANMREQHKFVLMPDVFDLALGIRSNMREKGVESEVLKMPVKGNHQDTTEFVRRMDEMGCDVLIVLGGDGTSRAAAKVSGDIPLLSISTGTNNVFPQFCEGTVAGLAAAAIAGHHITREQAGSHAKCIEIYKNGEKADIALIDAVVSGKKVMGEKAIWNIDEIDMVVTAQCHPAAIGFSSLAGVVDVVKEDDPFGMMVAIDTKAPQYMAPITAGKLGPFGITKRQHLGIDKMLEVRTKENCIVALDGEPEQGFKAGDVIGFKITWNGPRKVNVQNAVLAAKEAGMFIL